MLTGGSISGAIVSKTQAAATGGGRVRVVPAVDESGKST